MFNSPIVGLKNQGIRMTRIKAKLLSAFSIDLRQLGLAVGLLAGATSLAAAGGVDRSTLDGQTATEFSCTGPGVWRGSFAANLADNSVVSATVVAVHWTMGTWQGDATAKDGGFVIPLDGDYTMVIADDFQSASIIDASGDSEATLNCVTAALPRDENTVCTVYSSTTCQGKAFGSLCHIQEPGATAVGVCEERTAHSCICTPAA
jgi:hypothetical protein